MSLFFFSLFPLFVLAFIVIVVVAIIRAVVRAGNTGAGLGAPAMAVGAQLGPDGFWISSCPFSPGSIIHYHYWSNGLRRAGNVPFQPGADGRQFVYTGERPEQVAIVRVDELNDDGGVIVVPPIIDTGGSFWGSSMSSNDSGGSAPSSSSFPSAY